MRFEINFIFIADPRLDCFVIIGLCRDPGLDMILLEPDDFDVADLLGQGSHAEAILVLGGIRPRLRNCIQSAWVVPRAYV